MTGHIWIPDADHAIHADPGAVVCTVAFRGIGLSSNVGRTGFIITEDAAGKFYFLSF